MTECLKTTDFELYESNKLDEDSRSQLKLHLESCDSCSALFAEFQLRGKPESARSSAIDETVASADACGPSAGAADAIHATTSTDGARRSGIDATTSMDDVTALASAPLRKVKKRFPQIEGYKITAVIGQGGMGTVYRAVQTKLSRTVALKVLHAVSATVSPEAVTRFRREATAAARLHHTNIIPVYDYGECADGYFYAMELVTGQPLNYLVRRFAEHKAVSASPARLAQLLLETTMVGPTPGSDVTQTLVHDASATGTLQASAYGRPYFREVARWMSDAAEALHYAHQENIVHRDIKPANLILSTDGRVMIADFGLAKTSGDASMTRTGTLVGTLRYMSPEQAMAKRVKVDHRTDIYSLGATMYELLCFQPAFPGEDHNAILSALIARDPAAPHKVNHHAPAELSTICLKCLEKAPDARYADAKSLAEDLRRYLSDLPIAAKRPGPVKRVVKFVRRHKPQVIAATAAVLMLASIPIIMQQRRARLAAAAEAYENETQATYQSGLGFALQGDWAQAVAEISEALDRAPDNLDMIQGVAWAKLERNTVDPVNAGAATLREVDALCQRGLEIDSTSSLLWYRQGTARKRLEDYQGAIESFRKAIELTDGTDEVEAWEFASWSNLGAVYLTLGDLTRANENLREAAAKLGDAKSSFAHQVWRNYGALQLFLQDPAAETSIHKAIASNPLDVQSRVLKARMKLELSGHKDLEEALVAATTADDYANESDAKAKRIRALACLRNGRFHRASAHAEAALKLNDMPAINHLIMAISEARLGNTDLARRELEQAHHAWPEKLREPGSYIATLGSGGDLWIDSADELIRLRDEAVELLALAER